MDLSPSSPTGRAAVPGRLIAQLDEELAKRQFKAGEAYFERGDYEAALEEFEKSYQNSRRPALLYNIALTLEKLRRYGEALAFYQLYLQVRPDAPEREFLEDQIDLLKGFLEKEEKARAQPLPPAPPLPAPSPPEPASVTRQDVYLPPMQEEPAVQMVHEPSGRGPYGFLKWTSVSLSVAGLALGGIAYQRAERKESEHKDLVEELAAEGRLKGNAGNYRFTDQKAMDSYEERLNGLKKDMSKWDTIAAAGFIGGGALAVLGGVFFWLDHQRLVRMELETSPAGGSIQLRMGF